MRALVTGLLIFALPCAARQEGPLTAKQIEADASCTQRRVELIAKAGSFQGDAMIKRLIEADLKRALKEQAEGDADECLEALDHAAKLIAGDI